MTEHFSRLGEPSYYPITQQETLKDLLSLNAGPLSMIFERSNAFLRHIRFGEIEVDARFDDEAKSSFLKIVSAMILGSIILIAVLLDTSRQRLVRNLTHRQIRSVATS